MGDDQPIRITVIQPDVKGDIDRMGRWLSEEGVILRIVRPFDGDLVPRSVEGDGLIVLGGAMGALDEGEFPYLADIKSLLRTSVSAQIPVLGVCLGAQMLADALGGEVAVGARGLESGVVRVSLLEASANDPLMQDMPAEFHMPALHFDAVTRLPEGAVLLGTGDRYPNQVFRVGSAWGVQFHAEISPERFLEWRDEVPEAMLPLIDEQAREFTAADETISADAKNLAHRFVSVVRDRVASRKAR
ncbi:type 1 glutamine amidotransferase [Microbacterium sp. WCS2018Hpa-9]|uniref:type 1 glutamine amidotransferase n=1 Tax=Microbacterium sp. WCS2018Hpa-9 TaxID=3073635 RepID=UPI00288B7070|nr:type 1 glutamine amidotransferase [Microbacterium sp. WCS2018Hpa-9]